MCPLRLTRLITWCSDFRFPEVMEAVSTQPHSAWAKDSENGENLCLLKSHFPRWGGQDRNLALLCLVASGGITAGAPGLQDDSALSSLCLLCRRKLIFSNSLSCDCVMSVNQEKKGHVDGQKNVLLKLWDVHSKNGTSTHHQLYFFLLLRPEDALVLLKIILTERRGQDLSGIKFWQESAGRQVSCHSFQEDSLLLRAN